MSKIKRVPNPTPPTPPEGLWVLAPWVRTRNAEPDKVGVYMTTGLNVPFSGSADKLKTQTFRAYFGKRNWSDYVRAEEGGAPAFEIFKNNGPGSTLAPFYWRGITYTSNKE